MVVSEHLIRGDIAVGYVGARHSSRCSKKEANALVNVFTLWRVLWPSKGLHNKYVDVAVFLWLLVYTWENWALPAKSHNVPKIIQLMMDGSTFKGSLAVRILRAVRGESGVLRRWLGMHKDEEPVNYQQPIFLPLSANFWMLSSLTFFNFCFLLKHV